MKNFAYFCLALLMILPASHMLEAQTSGLEVSASGGLCYPELISDIGKYWKPGYNIGLGVGLTGPQTDTASTKGFGSLSLIVRYGKSQPDEQRFLDDFGVTRDSTIVRSEPLTSLMISGTLKFYFDLETFTQPYLIVGIGYYHLSKTEMSVEKFGSNYYLFGKAWVDDLNIFLTNLGGGLNFPIQDRWSVFVEAEVGGGMEFNPIKLAVAAWINAGTRVTFPLSNDGK